MKPFPNAQLLFKWKHRIVHSADEAEKWGCDAENACPHVHTYGTKFYFVHIFILYGTYAQRSTGTQRSHPPPIHHRYKIENKMENKKKKTTKYTRANVGEEVEVENITQHSTTLLCHPRSGLTKLCGVLYSVRIVPLLRADSRERRQCVRIWEYGSWHGRASGHDNPCVYMIWLMWIRYTDLFRSVSLANDSAQ